MKRAPRPLGTVIASDATLAAWEARRARELALTRALRHHLPRQLGERVAVRETESGTVELVTGAGAIAAAVRQRVPELRTLLERDGIRCGELKVRVHVSTGTAPVAVKPAGQRIDRTAVAPLASLERSLPAGPLKSALAKLLRRAG
jgi:hypothetical protein